MIQDPLLRSLPACVSLGAASARFVLLCPFLWVCYVISLYSDQISVLQIFSCLVVCLSIFLALSFKEQKFFILRKFSLSCFIVCLILMNLFWCVLPKKSLPNLSQKCFLMCRHLELLVLGFTFKSLILLSNFCL